jgi:hypothetical protein
MMASGIHHFRDFGCDLPWNGAGNHGAGSASSLKAQDKVHRGIGDRSPLNTFYRLTGCLRFQN